MIRFNNSENKKLLTHISNFIYSVCKGDRLDRITKIVTIIIKYILKKKKKIAILNFDCGSIEISKRLKKKILKTNNSQQQDSIFNQILNKKYYFASI